VKEAPWLLSPASELVAGRRTTLEPSEARHASGPLRLQPGDAVVLVDGAGAVASGEIALLGRSGVEVDISAVDHRPRPAPGLTLAVAVLAGAAMDLVVQKAVELGVETLVPVCSQRAQLSVKRAATRVDHWIRLSRQSLKQCRRAWALELASPTPLTELLTDSATPAGMVAHPRGVGVRYIQPGCARLLLIGPEGGFDDTEELALEAAGWPKVCLGSFVLRAETAAIAGAAVFGAGLHSTDV